MIILRINNSYQAEKKKPSLIDLWSSQEQKLPTKIYPEIPQQKDPEEEIIFFFFFFIVILQYWRFTIVFCSSSFSSSFSFFFPSSFPTAVSVSVWRLSLSFLSSSTLPPSLSLPFPPEKKSLSDQSISFVCVSPLTDLSLYPPSLAIRLHSLTLSFLTNSLSSLLLLFLLPSSFPLLTSLSISD